MPIYAPRVFVLVMHIETGEVVRQLGPYQTAAEARQAVNAIVWPEMPWERQASTWRAEYYPLSYSVPADEPERGG